MDNRFVFELRNRDWSLSIHPHIMCNKWTIGDMTCDIPIPNCRDGIVIEMSVVEAMLYISIQGGTFKELEKNSVSIPISSHARLHAITSSYDELVSIIIHPENKDTGGSFDTLIPASNNDTIVIGGNQDANIIINQAIVDKPFVLLEKKDAIWTINPLSKVPLGIYLNLTRIDKIAQAKEGDFLTFLGMQIHFENQGIKLSSDGDVKFHNIQYSKLSLGNNYPCLNRAPRQHQSISTDDIQIQDPPSAPQESKGNIVISLLPIVAMILLTVILRGSYSSDSNMILFSTLSMAIGGIGSAITYIQTGKDYKKKIYKRKEEYEKYIAKTSQLISQLREKEHDILCGIYIRPQEEINRIKTFSSSLYDRRPEDDDFLDLRFGYGKIRSSQKTQYVRHEVFEQTDDLSILPQLLSRRFEFISDLPVISKGTRANAVGIVGDKEKLASMLRILTLDVVSRHYSKDVNVYMFLPSFYQPELQAVRLFPHINNLTAFRRSLAYDEDSFAFLSEALFNEITKREQFKNSDSGFPWIIVFISTELQNIMRHPLMDSISDAAKLHILFIFLSESKNQLPQGCSQIVSLMNNANMGLLSHINISLPEELFEYSDVAISDLSKMAEYLAPVFCGDSSLATHLSEKVSLFDILQIQSASDLDIQARWKTANAANSLAAPIGIQDNGQVLYLDIHENAHGPHGLVAGTTGSGKSQVLISYLLSLSTLYSPEDLTFAVIDFKGGDIVKQLGKLPHLVGSITNIEKNEIDRSLRSITAEKNRRMILFDKEHANVSNISEYTQAFRTGKVSEPLPHLLILVDEFAELKSQYPDFLSALISLARVGRSLGIHLILCTQKPGGGVVDPQIWSNSNFKLCLRVQNREDSNEVLHSPLAAEIHERGRGYLQADSGMFELFQSGYSGVAESQGSSATKQISIWQMDLAGRSQLVYENSPEVISSQQTQREAIVNAICYAFQNANIQPPKQLCQPAIPNIIPYETIHLPQFGQVPIGLLDNPDNQSIIPLIIDLVGKNTLVVGNTQMGKTNLLVVILRWLAETYTAQEVAVYALDYNTYAIKSLQELSIIGGVVTEHEEERLKNLIKLLYQEIAYRKNLFDSVRAANYLAYRQTHKDLPIIIVMIDNYAVFHELYNDQYGDDLVNLVRDGTSYGITFIVTVQHVSTLSYKISYFFTQRIAMALSNNSDYSSIWDGCHSTIPALPGRVLFSQNKQFYEGQVYEAFSGKTEQHKVESMKAVIDKYCKDRHARQIPGVPQDLSFKYISENYPTHITSNSLIYGMGFDSIEPVSIRLGIDFSLALVGGNDLQRKAVVEMIISNICLQLNRPQIYIIDEMTRPLRTYRNNPTIMKYTCTLEEIQDIMSDVMCELEDRKTATLLDEDTLDRYNPIFVIINSQEALKYISEDISLLNDFKRISEDLSRMKIFFLYSNVPNRAIRYNSAEVIRMIGEEQAALLLSDLSSIKTYEINGSIIRNQGRPLNIGEAFLLNGEDVSRIKLFNT